MLKELCVFEYKKIENILSVFKTVERKQIICIDEVDKNEGEGCDTSEYERDYSKVRLYCVRQNEGETDKGRLF